MIDTKGLVVKNYMTCSILVLERLINQLFAHMLKVSGTVHTTYIPKGNSNFFDIYMKDKIYMKPQLVFSL